MTRILAVVMVAALLVGSGVYLAQSQEASEAAAAAQAQAEAQAQLAARTPEVPAELELSANYHIEPFWTDEARQSFERAGQALEAGKDYYAVIDTNKGAMLLDLYEEQTPITVNSFVFLALNRYYEGIVFHRVLEDFMAQTGDPTGTGTGGPGYQFADEIVAGLSHDSKGIVSMANAGPGTNGSQFFITFTATPWLDGKHTVFGKVIDGLEVLADLQRINPQSPSAVVTPDDPLSQLAEQGVTLSGAADQTIETYLTDTLGAMPSVQQTFTVDGYTGVVGRLETGETALGFFSKPDYIEEVIILTVPKDAASDATDNNDEG